MWVGRPFDEIEVTVEFARAIVLGVGGNRSDPGDIGCLQCSHDRVLEKTCAKSFTLIADGNAQPGKDHQRHWMPSKTPCQSFGSVLMIDMSDDERVKTDKFIAIEGYIGLGRATLLPLPGEARQKPIEFDPTAIKVIDSMVPPELFYAKPNRHRQSQSSSCSKTLGFVSNRARRGV